MAVTVFHNLEWQRTHPDLRVYLPESELGADAENQHFLVVPTLSGAWLAVWTMATYEGHADQRVVIARSISPRISAWLRGVVSL